MVVEGEVEAFMIWNFPSCPICDAKTGYFVSGISKDYVQCKSCKAKWFSPQVSRMKNLEWLKLWEPSRDGTGRTILRKKKSVDFWKNFKKSENNIEQIRGASLEADNETLRSEIMAILKTLKGDELSTLGRLSILFSGSTAESVITKQLKSLGDQNKIMIMQNELILRALNRNKGNSEN